MKNIEEESLIDTLSWCSVRDLPKEDEGVDVWIKAIGRVSKIDGSFSYVAMERGKNGEERVVRDFGNPVATNKVLSVYPYLYLDSRYIPNFKTQKKDERLRWLKRYGVEDDLENLSLKELDKMVINVASLTQLGKKW